MLLRWISLVESVMSVLYLAEYWHVERIVRGCVLQNWSASFVAAVAAQSAKTATSWLTQMRHVLSWGVLSLLKLI